MCVAVPDGRHSRALHLLSFTFVCDPWPFGLLLCARLGCWPWPATQRAAAASRSNIRVPVVRASSQPLVVSFGPTGESLDAVGSLSSSWTRTHCLDCIPVRSRQALRATVKVQRSVIILLWVRRHREHAPLCDLLGQERMWTRREEEHPLPSCLLLRIVSLLNEVGESCVAEVCAWRGRSCWAGSDVVVCLGPGRRSITGRFPVLLWLVPRTTCELRGSVARLLNRLCSSACP